MKRPANLSRPALTPRAIARIAAVLAVISGAIIFLLPFHGFLTVWGSTLGLDYALIRLWKEFLLVLLTAGGWLLAYLWYSKGSERKEKKPLRVGYLLAAMLAYLGLLGIIFNFDMFFDRSYFRSVFVGIILDARFILFFLIVYFISKYSRWIFDHWRQLLLIPAGAVVVFGIMQFFVLPPDFLTHFGYKPEKIPAVQTIDQKDGYQRIQSTLRGANPFGTYLILVITALAALVLRKKSEQERENRTYRNLYIVMLGLSAVALVLTFSRGAWLGMAAAAFTLLWLALRSERSRRLLAGGTIVLVVFMGLLTLLLRDHDIFQNVVFHTDEHSVSAESSNEGHFEATGKGFVEMLKHPLGSGIGSSGPASIHDYLLLVDGQPFPGNIPENYYVQIGQELGYIGLALFIAVNVLVFKALWVRRGQLLPRILLASFIGISVVNLMSHAWTDDTISYIWWGLAGAALAVSLPAKQKKTADA